ncbi:MAG: GDP-mannose 4,6-dehydratase [Patescibacteria group bacterium]|nr:GDP-mannose 4,6-dehydratase [Patescibacteria group bacterium]
MKTALITGITGQDGYFLSKLLLSKGYEVHGLVRRNSQMSYGTLRSLDEETFKKIKIHWGDVTDHTVVVKLINDVKFDEIYHLAAQSFVALSFTNPQVTYETNIGGTLNVVNAVKEFSPKTRLYFAATSELYGKAQTKPQNEATPFYPRSPYGVSKLAGFWTVKNYREAYDLFMCSGILFNHESEMRGEEFVTKKIVKGAIDVSRGKREFFEIGNLNARRDWGYADDYVEGMWTMLQQPAPDDFVLATGENHSIRDFVDMAFKRLKIELSWEGEGVNEIGKNKADGRVLVKVNPEFFRPSEVEDLIGDASKAKSVLGWSSKVGFEELVNKMVDYELGAI